MKKMFMMMLLSIVSWTGAVTAAEATPNTEMILISDVDLDLLNELHTYGSVRNLKDRRNDLYEVRMKK